MRPADVQAVGGELAALARVAGVPVLWRCAVSELPHQRLAEPLVHHLNDFCMAVKGDAQRVVRCRVAESTTLEAECRARRAPWHKACHAGVEELVVPLLAERRYLGTLIAGPWRGRTAPPGGTAAAWQRLPPLDERRRDDLATCLGLLARRIVQLTLDAPPLDARVVAAQAWIERHFRERFSAQAVARACGVSRSQLARLVAHDTGRSLTALVLERRLAEARRLLLATDLPLAEIAVAVGFADQSHLGLQFRRVTGITPRRFRVVGGI